MSKRTKSFKIRVTEDEHADLLERCGTQPLASWLRNLGLDQEIKQTRIPYPKIDPKALRVLSGIGNNINQIARIVNLKRQNIDKMWLLTALEGVNKEIKQLREELKNDSDISQ